MPETPRVTCRGCNYYTLSTADYERALAAGSPVPPGQCWRYPTPVARGPEDGCGEHSTLRLERQRYLAALIGGKEH